MGTMTTTSTTSLPVSLQCLPQCSTPSLYGTNANHFHWFPFAEEPALSILDTCRTSVCVVFESMSDIRRESTTTATTTATLKTKTTVTTTIMTTTISSTTAPTSTTRKTRSTTSQPAPAIVVNPSPPASIGPQPIYLTINGGLSQSVGSSQWEQVRSLLLEIRREIRRLVALE